MFQTLLFALTIALGVCLVPVNAACAYIVPIRGTVHLQAYTLTLHSLQQYQSGNAVGALQSLSATKRLMLQKPDQFSPLERARVGALTTTILSDVSLRNSPVKLNKSYEWVLNSLDPLSKYRQLQLDPPAPKSPAITVLENALRSVPKLIVVGPAARKFSIEFRTGMNDPQSTFDLEKVKSSLKASLFATDNTLHAFDHNSFRINAWLATPKEKRVFLTGARSDAPYVQKLKGRYESEGFMLFFYQDCKPLCDESTIGAFFGTSGTVVHIDSPGAKQSLFIPVEIGLISEHGGYGRKILVIDSSEFNSTTIKEGSKLVAAVLTCGTDALLDDDSLCGQLVR